MKIYKTGFNLFLSIIVNLISHKVKIHVYYINILRKKYKTIGSMWMWEVTFFEVKTTSILDRQADNQSVDPWYLL